jgi:Mn-dependent DtxR family transcriptional regulator
MASSGELIRMMNYVDDIAATLRRIVSGSAFISVDERKKLAQYMRDSDPSVTKMLEELEK